MRLSLRVGKPENNLKAVSRPVMRGVEIFHDRRSVNELPG